MEESSIVQEHITAGGDVVGGNKNINYYSSSPTKTLDVLYGRLKNERGKELDEFIEQLQHFANQVDREIIGLENKLLDAKLESFTDYALECKEKFEKQLYMHQYSLAAQKIYLYFLSKSRSIFKLEANPAFSGMSSHEKTKFVRERLVQVLAEELGQNPLEIGYEEIFGMVFFLTGNCHIHWKS